MEEDEEDSQEEEERNVHERGPKVGVWGCTFSVYLLRGDREDAAERMRGHGQEHCPIPLCCSMSVYRGRTCYAKKERDWVSPCPVSSANVFCTLLPHAMFLSVLTCWYMLFFLLHLSLYSALKCTVL